MAEERLEGVEIGSSRSLVSPRHPLTCRNGGQRPLALALPLNSGKFWLAPIKTPTIIAIPRQTEGDLDRYIENIINPSVFAPLSILLSLARASDLAQKAWRLTRNVQIIEIDVIVVPDTPDVMPPRRLVRCAVHNPFMDLTGDNLTTYR